jgi:hypothetical protein
MCRINPLGLKRDKGIRSYKRLRGHKGSIVAIAAQNLKTFQKPIALSVWENSFLISQLNPKTMEDYNGVRESPGCLGKIAEIVAIVLLLTIILL